jgi:hypothetical protein
VKHIYSDWKFNARGEEEVRGTQSHELMIFTGLRGSKQFCQRGGSDFRGRCRRFSRFCKRLGHTQGTCESPVGNTCERFFRFLESTIFETRPMKKNSGRHVTARFDYLERKRNRAWRRRNGHALVHLVSDCSIVRNTKSYS